MCTVNLTGEPVELPAPGHILLTSAEVEIGDGVVRLAPDCAAWWR
ncbi:DUF3459 domain-containing protein [Planobispora siamensis]